MKDILGELIQTHCDFQTYTNLNVWRSSITHFDQSTYLFWLEVVRNSMKYFIVFPIAIFTKIHKTRFKAISVSTETL